VRRRDKKRHRRTGEGRRWDRRCRPAEGMPSSGYGRRSTTCACNSEACPSDLPGRGRSGLLATPRARIARAPLPVPRDRINSGSSLRRARRARPPTEQHRGASGIVKPVLYRWLPDVRRRYARSGIRAPGFILGIRSVIVLPPCRCLKQPPRGPRGRVTHLRIRKTFHFAPRRERAPCANSGLIVSGGGANKP
jgi:hypothetical protein